MYWNSVVEVIFGPWYIIVALHNSEAKIMNVQYRFYNGKIISELENYDKNFIPEIEWKPFENEIIEIARKIDKGESNAVDFITRI